MLSPLKAAPFSSIVSAWGYLVRKAFSGHFKIMSTSVQNYYLYICGPSLCHHPFFDNWNVFPWYLYRSLHLRCSSSVHQRPSLCTHFSEHCILLHDVFLITSGLFSTSSQRYTCHYKKIVPPKCMDGFPTINSELEIWTYWFWCGSVIFSR